MKAILYLHEAKHAWHFFTEAATTYYPRTPEKQIREERLNIEFENRLLEQHLGQEYSIFIDTEAERVIRCGAIAGGNVCFRYSWFDKSIERFKEKFAIEYVNMHEESLFAGIVIHHIAFKIIERACPTREEANGTKEEFMAYIRQGN